jgi:hypothetical protein
MEEIWSKIDVGGFYEGLYEVSNLGRWKILPRILQTVRGKGWRLTKEKITEGSNSNGYRTIAMKKDRIKYQIDLHILVARAFIENPENKPQVNHKDGNRSNNNVDNLEWATPKENTVHAWGTKLAIATKGEERSTSKLTEEQVIKIRCLYKSGSYTLRELGKEFGVCKNTIVSIIQYKRWKHVA